MIKKALKVTFVVGVILSSIGLVRVGYFQVKAELAQRLMQSAWQQIKQSQQITGIKKIKPWPWADTWPIFELDIPVINHTSLVLKDSSGESLAFGPGLLSNLIQPGEKGNSYIAAHQDTHFRDIHKLQTGDNILINNIQGDTLEFSIDQIKVIDSRLEQPYLKSQEIRLTLVSCYPFDSPTSKTPYRYLVSAKLVESNILVSI